MQEIIPDVALIDALKLLASEPLSYRLFTNDVTPDTDTVLADLDEAAWTGYAPVACNLGEWIENVPVNGVGLLLHPPIQFLNSSGGDVDAYGYFRLYDTGELAGVCRFDGAPVTKHDGEAFTIIPILGDQFDEL